jgi:hypothetical protein
MRVHAQSYSSCCASPSLSITIAHPFIIPKSLTLLSLTFFIPNARLVKTAQLAKMPATWFLAPDFTFTADGPLRLGMVLPHWSQTTTVLADLFSNTISDFNLPNITTIIEKDNAYDRNQSRSNGFDIWSKFEGFASASISADLGKDTTINYSKTDHEIRFFSDPLMPETVAAIAKIPAVRAQIESGML